MGVPVLKFGSLSVDDGVNYIPLPGIDKGPTRAPSHFVSPPGRTPPRHTQTNYEKSEMTIPLCLAADSFAELWQLHRDAIDALIAEQTVTIALDDAVDLEVFDIWLPEEWPTLIQADADPPVTAKQFVAPKMIYRPFRWAFPQGSTEIPP